MRVKLLIATDDAEYAEHLSCSISERHADVIDVSVCRSQENLRELLVAQRFDAALLEASMIAGMDLSAVGLPLLLWTDRECEAVTSAKLAKIKKYQRVSSIASDVLEQYAAVSPDVRGPDSGKAHVTAVWSPAGGVGKTTVALALAAKRPQTGKRFFISILSAFQVSRHISLKRVKVSVLSLIRLIAVKVISEC